MGFCIHQQHLRCNSRRHNTAGGKATWQRNLALHMHSHFGALHHSLPACQLVKLEPLNLCLD